MNPAQIIRDWLIELMRMDMESEDTEAKATEVKTNAIEFLDEDLGTFLVTVEWKGN